MTAVDTCPELKMSLEPPIYVTVIAAAGLTIRYAAGIDVT
jgi:hypothetical protein